MQTRQHEPVELVFTYTFFHLRWVNGTVRCQGISSGSSSARLRHFIVTLRNGITCLLNNSS